MRVAAYVRHSGNRQQMDNLSLATQERLLGEYAARQGLPEPENFAEQRSAFTDDLDKRPVFARLVAAIERGDFAVLLIYDQDRLARDAALALMVANRLTRAGCRIILYNQPGADVRTPDGKMMYTFGAGIAEYTSAQISRKTRAGLAEIAARGGYVGSVPFGARRDAAYRLEVNPARAPILRELLARALHDSLQSIASDLNARGVPPPRGGARWHNTSVGIVIARGRWLLDQPDPWPALWAAASRRPRQPTRVRAGTIYELSGLLGCACGGRLSYGFRTNSAGVRVRYLQCRHWTRERPTTYRCPLLSRKHAAHYEDEATRQLYAMPDLTGVELATPDVRAARAAIRQRRLDLARAVALGLPQGEQDALHLAIDTDEAALPLDSGTEQLAVETLALARWRWPALDAAQRNAEYRRLTAGMVVNGPDLAIAWLPPIARMLAKWQQDRGNSK